MPRAHVAERIRNALATADRLLDGADALCQAKQEPSARVLYVQAVEEIGKAALLRAATPGAAAQVTIVGFNDRRERLLAAEAELGSHHFRIGEGEEWGSFEPSTRDPGSFGRLGLRLRGLFTDFRNGRWFEPLDSTSSLERRIRALRVELVQRQSRWGR